MKPTPTLTTARFTMRPLQRSDCAALFPTLSDEAQCRYLTREAFASEEELWGWLADPTWNGRTWIAVDADGQVAGRFVAMPGHTDDVLEIGYITVIEMQGQGVAKECLQALITHLFESGARKITAEVDTRNTPSIRVLEALNFTCDAYLPHNDETHIGVCDVYMYGKLRRDRP